MNNTNEISGNGSQVNASTVQTNRCLNKRNNRPNSVSPRRSKRKRTNPIKTESNHSNTINTLLTSATMGSTVSADNTTNQTSNEISEPNEETVAPNENNSAESVTQMNETNVCIDLTEDDSVVEENNTESDPEIQCISSVTAEGSDLCIILDIKRRNHRINSKGVSTTQPSQQSDDIIEIPDSQMDISANQTNSNEKTQSGSTPIRKTIKCPVCLDDYSMFRVLGKQLVSTNCGHLFCNNCIKEVIKTSKSCPNCRKKIATQKSFHPIYL